MASRVAVLQDLTPRVSKAYDALVDADAAVTLAYRSSVTQHKAAPQGAGEAPLEELPTTRDAWAERFLRALTEAREAELERGLTLVGPHRDDMTLSLGGMPVKGYASHGESWSMALSLRLAAYELLRAEGGDPVLVLDDVFAELDDVRRRRLAASVSDAEQVLVTAAVLADVPEVLSGARFAVADGQVRALDE
jgi:DNA replication and repair protein RecF